MHKTVIVGIVCLTGLAGGIGLVLLKNRGTARASGVDSSSDRRPAVARDAPRPRLAAYSAGFVDDSGFGLRYLATGPIRDRGDLAEVTEAYRTRGAHAIAHHRGNIARLGEMPAGDPERAVGLARERTLLATVLMSEGRFAEADGLIAQAEAEVAAATMPPEIRWNLRALRGVAAMRRGEQENCVACIGPSSCLFPLAPEAIHQFPAGSESAMRYFAEYLRARPEDQGIRWLLNISAMTLGRHPDGIPRADLIAATRGDAAAVLGRFDNVSLESGLQARGPNMAGGVSFDDFDGDSRPDLLVSSFDVDRGASLFVNQGEGTFRDRAAGSGLDRQPLALNLAQADYDNDGDLDVLMMRGGWEDPLPLSLMRNDGKGRFEDVTAAAGLGEPIASQAAAWGDYDNDGDADLFVCSESNEGGIVGFVTRDGASEGTTIDRNCRLYKNRGDGTFENVAAAAGVLNGGWTKGAAWGDYDADGRLDLYVSNWGGANRLYHNEGDGTFVDTAFLLGVTEPTNSFACWFWDYDNDGRLDIFTIGFDCTMNDFVANHRGRGGQFERPRLYRNLGLAGFRDVTSQAGLDRPLLGMGASFGDVDNDGFLDVYIGTGRPNFSYLIPNLLLRNVAGRRFEDVTAATGTGHLQKGHGIAFADYDADGDLDLFAQLGGAVPGDRSHNALFRNPGSGNHWLKIKLVGTRTNRSAFGARLRVEVVGDDGAPRSVYRQVGGGSSYGGNSLVESIGLGAATSVSRIVVTWPATGIEQTFQNVAADRAIEITEGSESIRTLGSSTAP